MATSERSEEEAPATTPGALEPPADTTPPAAPGDPPEALIAAVLEAHPGVNAEDGAAGPVAAADAERATTNPGPEVGPDRAAPPLPTPLPVRAVRRVRLTESAPVATAAPPPPGAHPPVAAWLPPAPGLVPGNGHGPDSGQGSRPATSTGGPAPAQAPLAAWIPPAPGAAPATVLDVPPAAPAVPRPDPDDLEALAPGPASTAAPQTGASAAAVMAAIWRSRGLVLGAAALGAGIYAQRQILDSHAIIPAIRWYTVAIVLLLVAWVGTYTDRSFVLLPFRRPPSAGTLPVRTPAQTARAARRRLAGLRPWSRLLARYPAVAMLPRYALAFIALSLNAYGVGQLRTHGYDSATGGWAWVGSLILLLLAFARHRPAPKPGADAGAADAEDKTDVRLSRALEITIWLSIFAIGLALRLVRLDDWMTGMHGDEGEAGMDALSILEGNHVSPFLTGWFSQPNFYYWGIALTMKVFGTGLGGLRMFSTLAGALMLLPFYPLVRQWFGVRVAIIASVLLAVSDVAIHFSRQEFSNITTPLFLVTGFFFFFRGLKDRRLLNFVLAGYAHILSMYFYLGGRLTPILVIGFLAYLFLLMPLLRLPGVYRAIRRRLPGVSGGRALGRAARTEARGVLLYGNQLIVYVLACTLFVSPWLAYFVDHTQEWNERANEKLIFNNAGRMAQQYGAEHTPLYVGLRMPGPDDILPLPVVFEQTPVSLMVARDGFWPRVMWGQLTTTLSILTYRGDASSVYTFTSEPVAKPLEAVLIILGLAWAAWRWRDTRMALLTMWFWSTVFIGGVLTIDAPYMARLVGVIPTLAVFAALPLNKLIAEFVYLISRFGRSLLMLRTGKVLTGIALFAVLGGLSVENYNDYYGRYLNITPLPFTDVTGQSYFVRQMNAQVTGEGRPLPYYYDLGVHNIYWTHGDNRFLNHGTPGSDMVNAANTLPVLDNGDRDVVYMVWDQDKQYLPVIKAYYPDGIETPFNYGPPGRGTYLFTSYRVTREQLDARRVLRATYSPTRGPAIMRDEPSLGSDQAPPAGLQYPVQARWTGSLVAPAFGRYHLHLDSPGAGSLTVDGSPVLTTGVASAVSDAAVILARGPHQINLTGTLANAADRVTVQWAVGGQAPAAVPRQYLWAGPGQALLGTVRPLTGDPFGPLPPDTPGAGSAPVTMRRVDGFLGFRDSGNGLSNGAPFVADWTSTLTAPQAGNYSFDVVSNGDSTITIDGSVVVNNRQGGFSPHDGSGTATLAAGPHQFEVRYVWSGDVGYLEAYWTPPDGEKTMLGPADFHAGPGFWAPGSVTEPGNVAAQLNNAPAVMPADAILDAHNDLLQPRGLALDTQGNFYVADAAHHRMAVLDPGGKLLRAFGQEGKDPGQFGTPEDVAVGPDGKVYVLDSALSRVQVFTPDGRFDHVMATPPGLCSPAGFTIGADGFLYVADTCGSAVRKYSLAGALQASYTAGSDPNTRLEQPVDLAVDKTGTMYVADLRNRVVQLDPKDGTIRKTWPLHIGTGQGAANLALAGTTLYLTDPDRGAVDSIDLATGRIDSYGQPGSGSGQFSTPTGIAAGPDGKLYVVDSDLGRIQVFNHLAPK